MMKCFLLAAALIPTAAAAHDATVRVDGRATPWDVGMNPKMAYGRGDGMPPRYVFSLALVPGTALRFTASGTVTVLPPDADPRDPRDVSAADANRPTAMFTSGYLDAYTPGSNPKAPDLNAPRARRGAWGPEGQPYRPSDGNRGFYGTYFPSFYLDHGQYPVRVNELLGAFVDADGTVVGKPFVIGGKATVTVPQGAVAIALGLNGESFEKNRGGYQVSITDTLPQVIVEDVPAADKP